MNVEVALKAPQLAQLWPNFVGIGVTLQVVAEQGAAKKRGKLFLTIQGRWKQFKIGCAKKLKGRGAGGKKETKLPCPFNKVL